jgi:hypothetical protein
MGENMTLSAPSIETLIDLVEIKLSCMQVCDREDAREQAGLERCLRELTGLRPSASASRQRRELKAA